MNFISAVETFCKYTFEFFFPIDFFLINSSSVTKQQTYSNTTVS